MDFHSLKKDIQSSLVVFLVALPLCLGIALASNAPLASGIFSGIVGGIVIGIISGSQISVSGPANTLTIVFAAGMAGLGSLEAMSLAVFIAGGIQILFSFLRAGTIGDYFPNSVIKGMLAAIGIILILKQFPHAVGYDVDYMGDDAFFEKSGNNTFSQILNAFNFFHPGAVLVSMVSLGIILSWEKGATKGIRFFQIIPGALVAILAAVCINSIFKLFFPSVILNGDHLVNLPFTGGFSELWGQMRGPSWELLRNSNIYPIAFSIAIIGSLESLLSVDAADKFDEHGRFTNKNRELLAQGVGNALCGLVGGIPVASVIVRSSVNVSAGAQTKLSSIFHGVWILLSVAFIPHLLNKIPLPVLASILLLVGYKLSRPGLFISMYRKGWNQFIPFIVTVFAILFSNLLIGIIIGMIIGFIFVIRSNIHKSIVEVNSENRYLIRFYKDVSFLQKAELQQIFLSIPENANVVIDGSQGVFVDDDILDVIEEFIKRGQTMGITVQLKKSSLALCPIFKEV
jgi:MFS superfamily sulfate permease-like transporter